MTLIISNTVWGEMKREKIKDLRSMYWEIFRSYT